jgi:hypothetical protein
VSVYRATWSALVRALSNQVVAQLAAQGLPPLTPEIDGTPGAIVMGPQYVAEHGSPPRIVMTPTGFPFENSRDVVFPSGKPRANPSWDPRAIGVQWKTFEVQCWGCDFSSQTTPAPGTNTDYDAAQILCEQVWQAAQALTAGEWRTTKGEVDANPKLIRLGHVITFDLAISTPAPDFALPFAPNPTVAGTTTEIAINGGTPVPP